MHTTPTLERLLRTREVAELEGMSTRWLSEKVRTGLFPRPDLPALSRGAPDRWYASTLQRFRQEREATAVKTLPAELQEVIVKPRAGSRKARAAKRSPRRRV